MNDTPDRDETETRPDETETDSIIPKDVLFDGVMLLATGLSDAYLEICIIRLETMSEARHQARIPR